jgi:glucosamine-6-phosphate deaminase
VTGARIVVLGREEAGAFAAGRILERARDGRLRRLGVATGGSAEPVYAALRAQPEAAGLLGGATAYALDEYVGLSGTHPQSYQATLRREYLEPLGLPPEGLRVPDGAAADPHDEAARFDAELTAAGGVDLQILGIGSNGHIAFNEPGSDLAGRTRVQELSEQTRTDNARFFGARRDVPTHAITQGVGTILSADEILLLAFGTTKARALHAALTGPISSDVPASALQHHPRVTVLADPDAVSRFEGAARGRWSGAPQTVA